MVIWCCVHFGLKCGNSEKKNRQIEVERKVQFFGEKIIQFGYFCGDGMETGYSVLCLAFLIWSVELPFFQDTCIRFGLW